MVPISYLLTYMRVFSFGLAIGLLRDEAAQTHNPYVDLSPTSEDGLFGWAFLIHAILFE